MSASAALRPAHFSKLNDDLVYEIFFANTLTDEFLSPYDVPPLCERAPNVTRRASQVCRSWRNILLHSPLIWARCMDLEALDQSSDLWRNLVLQRAGQSSMLVVTARLESFSPQSRMAVFLAGLLDTHWARIGELYLSIWRENPEYVRIVEPLRRPADNLKVFVLRAAAYEEFLPLTFKLFRGHAPHLSCLVIPNTCGGGNNLKAPSMFTRNLRHLILPREIKLTAIDLLNACVDMPLLETINIHLSNLVFDDVIDLDSLPRPVMSRLNSIAITCPTLNIFPVFWIVLFHQPGVH